ncbi:hypothetical protein Ancab_007905 [Ancistrocladus abbreviatus]
MGRSPCCDKNGIKKGPWTPEEDQKLIQYIQTHGPSNWRTIPKNAGLQRCGKSCRLRWTNYLRPDIKRGRFSFEEEETIIQLHSVLGNKWSVIAARLPGRTDNEIKNYWNTHIRKRFLRMGIDPVTHAPRLDALDYLSAIMGSSNSQLNLTNLLGLQALLNPQFLRLLNTSISTSSSPPINQLQNPEIDPVPQFQPNVDQLQERQNQLAQVMQANAGQQVGNTGQFDLPNPMTFSFQTSNACSPDDTAPSSYVSSAPDDQMLLNQWDNSGFGQLMNSSNKQDLGFDSVGSTPLSSPIDPLNASSTFMYSSSSASTEDERESYSRLFHFEFPEGSLDISDLL